jgi:hypothetical protein
MKPAQNKLMEGIVSVIHVHTNKWVVVDVQNVSILPMFQPVVASLLLIRCINCLQNMDF